MEEFDTRKYILHRLRVANKNSEDIFTRDAITAVYKFSSGVPRLINQLCDSALLSAYIYEQKQVDLKVVQEVITESPVTVIGDSKEKHQEGLKI